MGELAEAVREATGESVELACVYRGYAGEEASREAEARGASGWRWSSTPGPRRASCCCPEELGGGALLRVRHRFRRLAKDRERLPETVAGLHLVDFARLFFLHRVLPMPWSSP